LHKLFPLKGLNFVLLGVAIGLKFFWALLLVIAGYLVIIEYQSIVDLLQMGMLMVSFLGPLWIGWILVRMAEDLHGPSYGLFGSLGGLVVIALVLIPTGIYGALIALTAFWGGLNGGIFTMRKALRS
jgi:hypothetical protein